MLKRALLVSALLTGFVAQGRAVTIDWSPVGNPGNAADTAVMQDGTTGYGSVAYNYNIGTYEVTNNQYVEFLNSNDPTGANTLALYSSLMSGANHGGINYNSGAASGSKYNFASGAGNHPVIYETWYDAIRFANWLNNGQTPGSTETGAYTLLGGKATTNANTITRNAGATVFLPSEDEWYKAAYYNPATSSYYLYPTSSNTLPTASNPTALPNHANFFHGGVGNLTDVGAYSGTTSPYGAFDMGGNVIEWNESLVFDQFDTGFRGVRGGSWATNSLSLPSSFRGDSYPATGSDIVGFRVAMVPEPASFVLAALGLASSVVWIWKGKHA